jgi:acylphosphatase
MICRKVVFHGKVQGVSFRRQTALKADELSVSGYVRNNADGTVEAIFMGSEKNVKDLINFCRTSVDNAEVTSYEEKETVWYGDHGFRILH